MSAMIPRFFTAASRHNIRRAYATHASSAQLSVSQVNGIKVVTSDEGRPTSTISVVLKAGSRYESSPGMSHVLKNLVFKATDKRSALSLIRETEHLGGVLSSSFGREHLVLSADFLRGDEGYFTEVLGDVLSCSKLSPYEYAEDVVPQVASEFEQATQDPAVLALDVAHQVAFRKGLGNSLFASPHAPISHSAATSYALSAFGQASNAAIIATGVNHATLSDLVADFFKPKAVSSKPLSQDVSQYFGGEVRIPVPSSSDCGHLLLAFQGASRSSPEYAVLHHLLGGPSHLKWTQGTSRIAKLSTASVDVNTFNLAYSDAGLFGICVTAPASQIETATRAALSELQAIAKGVDGQEVKKGAAKAKFAVAAALEHGSQRTEALGIHALDTTAASSLEDVYRSLDAVTPSQVSEAAAKALASRPTMVALGDAHQLPYADAFVL